MAPGPQLEGPEGFGGNEYVKQGNESKSSRAEALSRWESHLPALPSLQAWVCFKIGLVPPESSGSSRGDIHHTAEPTDSSRKHPSPHPPLPAAQEGQAMCPCMNACWPQHWRASSMLAAREELVHRACTASAVRKTSLEAPCCKFYSTLSKKDKLCWELSPWHKSPAFLQEAQWGSHPVKTTAILWAKSFQDFLICQWKPYVCLCVHCSCASNWCAAPWLEPLCRSFFPHSLGMDFGWLSFGKTFTLTSKQQYFYLFFFYKILPFASRKFNTITALKNQLLTQLFLFSQKVNYCFCPMGKLPNNM